ncbi:MAG: DUF3108 domain-containing protein [Hymenobacter sp.]|nr:MAG: DUF3108 domain-containing protein [Hymenobacter sp.]
MIRRWLLCTPLLLACTAWAQPLGNAEPVRIWPNVSFKTGETIHYKVHYGLINAAEATVETSGSLDRVAERPCYKATVSGHTTGSFDFFLHIHDQWRAYIDTTSILPLRSTRDITEKGYHKKETVDFDHRRDVADVQVHDKDNPTRTPYKIPNNAQELVSGFYYLRTLHYEHMKPGEVIKMPGFFDESTFNLEVTFKGREVIETKAGTIRVLKLVPKMPSNKLFKGEEAVKIFLSDDRNKIPVLFQAEMFVGAIKVDMYKYEGLKSKLNMVAAQ